MPLTEPRRSRLAAGIVFAIAFAIVGALVWGFGQQLALARQIRAEEMRLEQAVAAGKARNKDLLDKLEYVKSDEYVEQWAREGPIWARPGEIVVIPLVDEDEEPIIGAQSEQPSVPESQPFWIELWESVFGSAENP